MIRRSHLAALILAALVPVSVSAFATLRSESSSVATRDFVAATVVSLSANDDFVSDESASNKDSSKKPVGGLDLSNSPFLQGEELKQLRSDLESYRENLKWAQVVDDKARIKALNQEIEEKERLDPEVVYKKARRLIAEAKAASRAVLKPDLKEKLIEHWSEQAQMAQACLPRYHMEGLWVGNYGGGPQLVNITYAGDTLVATKVTGDETVPRGEVSFTANLSPPPLNNSVDTATEEASSPGEEHTVLQSKYGESIFPGQGQLSKKNYKDAKFISGVFIVYDTHRFSFSWVPTKHHVFFVRPSPHETIRLLRDVISKEDEVDNMREHLTRCYEMDMTTSIAREQQRNSGVENEDPFQRIKRQSDLEIINNALQLGEDGKQQGGSIFQFWRANKWKRYIDRVLGGDDDSMQ